MLHPIVHRLVLIAIVLAYFTSPLAAADKVTSGEFIIEPPTLISFGFEWQIQGDDNRNASVAVFYRRKGDTPCSRRSHRQVLIRRLSTNRQISIFNSGRAPLPLTPGFDSPASTTTSWEGRRIWGPMNPGGRSLTMAPGPEDRNQVIFTGESRKFVQSPPNVSYGFIVLGGGTVWYAGCFKTHTLADSAPV